MADPTTDNLFREIDEDIRHEKYAKLWKSYGGYVIAAAVLLVVGVGGIQGWYSYNLSTREAASDQLVAAQQLIEADPGAAEQVLLGLADDGPAGYAMLARFQSAALIGQRGERDLAAAAYWELSEQDIHPIYRDLAIILGAQQILAKPTALANPDELTERLERVVAPDNPWRFSARELQAVIARQTGENDRARKLLDGLAGDPTAPGGIRARANELLAAIGDT